MADGNGIAQTNHYRNESDAFRDLARNLEVDSGGAEGAEDDLTVVFQPEAEKPVESIGIERADGALIIRLDGKPFVREPKGNAKEHDANLAEYIDDAEQARICDELLNGIDSDLQTRLEWLERRAAGIKHLALKIENPRSPSADADTAVEGQATIRTPIMLDAVLRFQANARGELLPAGGPVKMRNDSMPKTPHRDFMEQQMQVPRELRGDDRDAQADALEMLFNRYLTEVDKEYYPDTVRMFFLQGFGGSGFKKVYRCPIKRRPVARSIDAADIIVSDNEVSLHECGRVTHRIFMRQSVMRRMQLAGTYLDVDLTTPVGPTPDAMEQAESDVAGLASWSQRPQDYKHTVYESYCELDIAGFEHTENGKITGLPLPYRVSIDKDSQTILEIRRNWQEDDDRYIKHMPIVKYVFVDGMGFYGIGLLHIMGNATAAITTAWRLALDSASFASWPGFLYSETVGRQDTMTFRVGLASGVRVNTGGQPIQQHIMDLPYKDVTTGLGNITTKIEEEARRVGGTPELMVGEGRQDVPVGTTIAMLDQAVKVLDSVHKGMHIAQGEEFSLLRELFKEDPDALLCAEPRDGAIWQWQRDDLIQALNDCNLTPQADPNTPSHTIRVMKAVALVQLVQLNPPMWDLHAVVRRVASMVGLGNVDELFAPQQGPGAQQDPKNMAKIAELQQKTQKMALEEKDSQRKAALQELELHLKGLTESAQLQDNAAERASREKIEGAKLAQKRMELAQTVAVHPLAAPVAQTWPGMPGGRII
jgi:hypothetical protein